MPTNTHDQVFARELADGSHSRRLEINRRASEGWGIREQRDGVVVREATYENWHRVELEMSRFSAEAAQLMELYKIGGRLVVTSPDGRLVGAGEDVEGGQEQVEHFRLKLPFFDGGVSQLQ